MPRNWENKKLSNNEYNLLHVTFYVCEIFYEANGYKKHCNKGGDEHSWGAAEKIESQTWNFWGKNELYVHMG